MAKKVFFSWFRRSSKEAPQENINELEDSKNQTESLNAVSSSDDKVEKATEVKQDDKSLANSNDNTLEKTLVENEKNSELASEKTAGLVSEKIEQVDHSESEDANKVEEVVASETKHPEQAEKPDDEKKEAESEKEVVAQESEKQTQDEKASDAESKVASEPEKVGFFKRLVSGLKRTRESIGLGLSAMFKGRKIDDEFFEDLETTLVSADVGVETTSKLIDKLTKASTLKELKDGESLVGNLKTELHDILDPVAVPFAVDKTHKPYVILMIGVNGVGKTTTIGKMTKILQNQGLKVMLAAGDTFRAAAVEQLKEWGERNKVPVISQDSGADSASVIFDALKSATAKNYDVLIADTAGRLQNKANLMEELRKIVRVMQKVDPTAPHEVMLTLDAGTGQNAINQVQIFGDAVKITGINITKLDGTAKGGVIFNIADKFGIPIRYIGIGEKIDDLRVFNADDFIEALFAE